MKLAMYSFNFATRFFIFVNLVTWAVFTISWGLISLLQLSVKGTWWQPFVFSSPFPGLLLLLAGLWGLSEMKNSQWFTGKPVR